MYLLLAQKRSKNQRSNFLYELAQVVLILINTNIAKIGFVSLYRFKTIFLFFNYIIFQLFKPQSPAAVLSELIVFVLLYYLYHNIYSVLFLSKCCVLLFFDF